MKRRDFITAGSLAATAGLVGLPLTGSASTAATNEGGKYQFTRSIPVDKTVYDLIIAGGGPAGIAAGIAAARLGAKVLIVEAMGCLGGMGTSGLVTAFDPMANGKEMLVGGIMREIVEKLYARGFLGPQEKPEVFEKEFHHWTAFQLEGYKLLLDELVTAEAGIEVRFFTRIIEADFDRKKGIVNGVIQQNVEGLRYLKGKTFIDATGDAILSDLCGVTCREAGRDTPHIMPATLCSYFSNIDFAKVKGHIGTMHPLLVKAFEDGHFTQIDRHLPGISRVNTTLGYLNGGHVFGLDALNCESLTQGMMTGRRIVQEYLSFYRKYVPGFENIELANTATVMGVRESRRIVGEYEMSIDDYLKRREFPDQIGIFNKFVDTHPYDTSEAEFNRHINEDHTVRLNVGEYFGIPYSIIVPKGWTNLWTAGRCSSSDIQVHGSIRVQPAASMMGQAAGTAAVQSIKTGQPACDLNTETLVQTLRAANAILPQKTLSAKMTRV
ncbi:membrane protein [Bacteroidia bacterium]|nr:membrane protein [Bacteroidia bacterium]